ncbi:hypothetical protein F5Y10DRAFT_285846 [Nemania abortiva]|nr:hypothetical protein F5Y10DRAFT_285846 [Nemania abortiva]
MMRFTDSSTFRNPCCFSSNFPIPENTKVPCNFITFLAAAQKLGIPFLNVTWESTRQPLGRGGTSEISQGLMNQQTSFAFKRVADEDKPFRSEQEIMRCLINEITILDHLMAQKHQNILEFQGVCWDVSDDLKVWPALVFEKSHFGDLHRFATLPVGKELDVMARLKICYDIGNAVAHLHATGVIHGDIKPDNVLIFQGNDGSFVPKIADFGYSTRFSRAGIRIVLPQSRPWCAPELDEYPDFTPEQALQTDVFSFGLLTLWFIFEQRLLGSPLQLHKLPSTYEDRFRALELLKDLKQEGSLTQFANSLVMAEESLTNNTRQMLQCFFEGCLAGEPETRYSKVEHSLELLNVHGNESPTSAMGALGHRSTATPTIDTMDEVYLPVESDFKLFPSIFAFYSSDYRLRLHTLQSLERILAERPSSPLSTQLALCYALGFGRPHGGKRLDPLLYSKEDLKAYLHEVTSSNPTVDTYVDTLYEGILGIGHDSPLVLAEYYQGQNVLETAENVTMMDIKCLDNILPAENPVLTALKSILASIMSVQGKWNEAERLETEVLTARERTIGREELETLRSMTNLAALHFNQGKWKEAERIETEVTEKMERILGRENRLTLGIKSMLAASYLKQGKLDEAESLELDVLDMSRKVLGPEHPDTINHMLQLAVIYRDKADTSDDQEDDFQKGEKLELEAVDICRRIFGEEHTFTLDAKSLMASTYRRQERYEEAESLEAQILDLHQRIFGLEHPDTLFSMTNLASTYLCQDKFNEAEKLLVECVDLSQKMIDPEHPDTLIRMSNLATVYMGQERFVEAERLQVRVFNIAKRDLGHEHSDTIGYMENLLVTYWGQGKSKLAMKLQAELIAITHNLSALVPMAGVVRKYLDQGKFSKAEKLLLKLLEIQQNEFHDQSESLDNKQLLATTYFYRKKYEDAERILMELLESQQDMGLRVACMELLAKTYIERGKFQEAEMVQIEVLDILRKGTWKDPVTLGNMATLAEAQIRQGKRDEAINIVAEAADMSQEILGPEHPETMDLIATVKALRKRRAQAPSQPPSS